MGSAMKPMNCIQRIYLCITSLIAVLGCEDVLLIPETIRSDDYISSYSTDKLLDGSHSTFWMGAGWAEDVFYDFSDKVIVKDVLIQKYSEGYLDWFYVTAGYSTIYWESSVDDYGAYNVFTSRANERISHSYIKFYFRSPSSSVPVRVSRAEVWGCYVTTTPTTSPTTSTPTTVPSPFPTTSPSPQPTTFLPSNAPSHVPTISPTSTPTTAKPTTQPSTFPTAKPTSNPSIVPTSSPSSPPTSITNPTALPSASPTMRPTSTKSPSTVPTMELSAEPVGFRVILGLNELLIIAAVFSVIFCGLFISRRRKRRVTDVNHILEMAKSSAMNRVHTLDDDGQIYGEEGFRVA